MGRPPCCDKSNVKRGPWTAEEDAKILAYISTHGIGNWTLVPKKAGLNRCGKSCRLRWTNYLRPDLKHDSFTPQEEELIINLHQAIGSRWSLIAKRLPGRTDNDVKNYWNTKLKKKLIKMGIDPITHKPLSQILSEYGNISSMSSTTALMCSKPDLSSVFPGSSTSFGMVANPKPEHIQDNSSTTNSLSWEFLAQFQATNLDNNMQQQQQPHFLAEVSPSCSSSSSSAFFPLSSPQSHPCQESQAHQSVPSSPFTWSELLCGYPLLVEDQVQQQDEEHDIHGMLSSSNTSTLTQADEITQCKFPSVDELQIVGTVEHGAIDGSHGINSTGASSSSASSFVDGILDMDREMSSQFPQLMDPSFDYC